MDMRVDCKTYYRYSEASLAYYRKCGTMLKAKVVVIIIIYTINNFVTSIPIKKT